jgi:DNA-binding transcriptional ArsR family regulator
MKILEQRCINRSDRLRKRRLVPTPTARTAADSSMGDNSEAETDIGPTEDILKALDDPDCRAILRETAKPMTANELVDTCDIPRSTLYRKLELLSSASLIREREKIKSVGGRVTHYRRSFEDITIRIDDDGKFSVSLNRSQQPTDQRLADMWSTMRDEV